MIGQQNYSSLNKKKIEHIIKEIIFKSDTPTFTIYTGLGGMREIDWSLRWNWALRRGLNRKLMHNNPKFIKILKKMSPYKKKHVQNNRRNTSRT